jgi:hypothetical protein
MTTLLDVTARQSPETYKEPRDPLKGTNSASLCSLAGRYDYTIPNQFLAPIECLNFQEPSRNRVLVPARQTIQPEEIDNLESILAP